MAAARRVVKLTIGRQELAELRSIAGSRTEAAGRVERARMLLAYREDPSFFAVGRALITRRCSAALNAPRRRVLWRLSRTGRVANR
jgi:hypothetical protein